MILLCSDGDLSRDSSLSCRAYQCEADDAYAYLAYEQYCADNSRRSETTTGPGSILHRQAGEAWESTASGGEERVLLKALIAALDQERQR